MSGTCINTEYLQNGIPSFSTEICLSSVAFSAKEQGQEDTLLGLTAQLCPFEGKLQKSKASCSLTTA